MPPIRAVAGAPATSKRACRFLGVHLARDVDDQCTTLDGDDRSQLRTPVVSVIPVMIVPSGPTMQVAPC